MAAIERRESGIREIAKAGAVVVAASLAVMSQFSARGAQTWADALAQMPLGGGVRELTRTNCVPVMLQAFQSNAVVKGFVFLPGATDEFYMFRRAQAELTNASPTLLDAVSALTNQTLIRATFRPPLLLLHTDEDPLEPDIAIQHAPTADRLKQITMRQHLLCNDSDWDALQPRLRNPLRMDIRPWRYSVDSWHFYRHSFAGWGLSGWEALQATALAGKTRFTVRKKQVLFEVDPRVRATPKLSAFPR